MKLTFPPALRPGQILSRWTGEGRPRLGLTNHISFGAVCHMAAALQASGLRRWSGPFDWLFSSPALVAGCLREDFESFLDPSQLRSVPKAEVSAGSRRQCRHLGLEERYGVPILFNHHDPVGSESDRLALERAVGRLRVALTGPHENVFYLLAAGYRHTDRDLAELADVLTAYPSRNRLVEVSFDGCTDGERGLAVESDGRPERAPAALRVTPGSKWLGLRFADPADDALLDRGLAEIASLLCEVSPDEPDRAAPDATAKQHATKGAPL